MNRAPRSRVRPVPRSHTLTRHQLIALEAVAQGLHREVPPDHALVIRVVDERTRESRHTHVESLRPGFDAALAALALMNAAGIDEWIPILVFDRDDLEHSIITMRRALNLERAA